MNTYQYQLLRFLPDRVSGEFVNVGLVMFDSKEKKFVGKVAQKVHHALSLFPETNSRYLQHSLRAIEMRIEQLTSQLQSELDYRNVKTIEDITKNILPKDSSSLYFTEVKLLNDIHLDAAFNDLAERVININDEDDEFHRMEDKQVWSRIYKKHFEENGIMNRLTKHTVRTSLDEITFDYAVKNHVWHCFETVSFDLVRPDSIKNKVYKWFGKMEELRSSREEIKIYLLAQLSSQNPELNHFIEKKLGHLTLNKSEARLITEDKAIN